MVAQKETKTALMPNRFSMSITFGSRFVYFRLFVTNLQFRNDQDDGGK